MNAFRTTLHMPLGLAMGTLNTCLLMLLIVLSLHVSNELSDSLGSLSTALGLCIFVLLWSTTTYCTYRGWAETAPEGIDDRIGQRFLRASAYWGTMSGIAFFLIALMAFLAVASYLVLAGREEGSLIAIWVFGILAGAFGVLVSGTVGLILGIAFATFDVLLALTARRLLGSA